MWNCVGVTIFFLLLFTPELHAEPKVNKKVLVLAHENQGSNFIPGVWRVRAVDVEGNIVVKSKNGLRRPGRERCRPDRAGGHWLAPG